MENEHFECFFEGILLVVDATTMQELGRAFVPISIPFGFHNRFFTSQELGIEKKEVEINNNLRKMRKRPQNGGGPFFGNLDRGFWGRMDGGTTMGEWTFGKGEMTFWLK